GKDFIAAKTRAKIFGFSDPLYAIASHFFGVEVTSTQNKDLPGMRAFLQTVGQWGKNIISDEYPVTPARAAFGTMIRSLAGHGFFQGYSVNWEDFGRKDSIWTDALCARAAEFEGHKAASNVRFEVEFNRLSSEGWTHFHVMCSPATWAKRLEAKKLTPQSKEVADYSEQMAIKMDRGITHQIKQPGGKIRCIWNDDAASCPSPRLFTVTEFLASYNAPQAPANIAAAE
ncbi:hypothetical protein L0337_30925, partial [candidate division KSB1 bacterium]|nr:hypothetical protein [candidate division KSB1 bacterium]